MKKSAIIASTLVLLTIVLMVTYHYLKKHNKYVEAWSNYPGKVKVLNTKLFLERPFFWIFQPGIDTSQLSLSKDKLEKALQMGANWIVSMQTDNGRYNYWYNPEKKKYSSKYDDNFLRQAGTGYSLMLAYEITGNDRYKESAITNLKYLFNYYERLDSSSSYFLYRQKAKLGGIALPMLTMLKYRAITGDTLFDQKLKSLAEMILYLQDYYDSGKYKSTYVYRGDFNYEETSGWESSIYPGEAMLALVFMYQQFGDEKYRLSLEKAFDYYSNKGRWKKSAFMPWTISAFSELYKITTKNEYAEFVYKMCKLKLRYQNLNKKRITYGSLTSVPTVFAATTFEGIGDAIPVAKLRNDKKLEKKFVERSMIAYGWLLELQYAENDAVDAPALGGFPRSLHESEIRIDNTQHAISAIGKGLKYIYNTELKAYQHDSKKENR